MSHNYTGSPVNFLTVTVLNASTAFVQWEHQDAAESYEIEVQAIDAPDIPSKEIVLCGNSRNRIINNLAAGKRYRFTITPIYENDTPGTDVSTVQTIVESSKQLILYSNFIMNMTHDLYVHVCRLSVQVQVVHHGM